MLVNHEVPLCLLGESVNFNDYDYWLVHLLKNEQYREEYLIRSRDPSRRLLLDNSAAELKNEKYFDFKEFAKRVEEFKPTEYIIPDEFNDFEKTIENLERWLKNYGSLPGKKIGVIHGKTEEELVKCYRIMSEKVDKIAINCGDDFYSRDLGRGLELNKTLNRISFINYLIQENIINYNKPHHILGCYLPQEFKSYKGMSFIETIDTSNPIIHGIEGIRYSEKGLESKSFTGIDKVLEIEIDERQRENIYYNIEMFRSFIK